MTVIAPTLATTRLATYLRSIGGTDIHECYDDKGEPDPLAARRLAEGLRAQHTADLGQVLTVSQSAHRVIVALV